MDSIKPKYQRSNAETKVCSKCLEEKPTSDFYKDPKGCPRYICKSCAKSVRPRKTTKVWGTPQSSNAETKVCAKCKQEKPIGDFYRNKNGIVRYKCKRCVTEYNLEWKKNNREKANSQPWRKSEKYKARKREERRVFCKRHPEKIREQKKDYREKHPEKNREKWKAYREKYPEKIKAQKQRRRALKMSAPGSFTGAEWLELKKNFNNLCARCGQEKPLTVDHVIPLVAGGSNSIDNIQPLCLSCNSAKGTKTIDYRITR